MVNIADKELMTVGSVWQRENGKKSTLLCITNENLPQRLQAKFEPQVVYVNEKLEVLSTSITKFLARRTFYNVDPDIENQMNTLLQLTNESPLVFNEDADAEAQDEDAPMIFGEGSEGIDVGESGETVLSMLEDAADTLSNIGQESSEIADVAVRTTHVVGEDNSSLKSSITYVSNDPDGSNPVDPALLSSLTVGYEQDPLPEEQVLLHKLIIETTDEVTVDDIHRCFDSATGPVFSLFTLSEEAFGNNARTIDWTASMGVFPFMSNRRAYVQVILVEDANITGEADIPQSDTEDMTDDSFDLSELAPNEAAKAFESKSVFEQAASVTQGLQTAARVVAKAVSVHPVVTTVRAQPQVTVQRASVTPMKS